MYSFQIYEDFKIYCPEPLILYCQMISLTWIHEFVRLSGRVMLPHLASILTAIVPCLALDDPTYASKFSSPPSWCVHSRMVVAMPVFSSASFGIIRCYRIRSSLLSNIKLFQYCF